MIDKLKPYSATLLAIGGFTLMAIGSYFIFFRPALLPEDYKYIEATSLVLQKNIPLLSNWLQKVFWVMGCYIFSTGLLTIFISRTSFRKRIKGVVYIVAITGISSIASMTVINFMLASDFRWILLVLNLPWLGAVILYSFEKDKIPNSKKTSIL